MAVFVVNRAGVEYFYCFMVGSMAHPEISCSCSVFYYVCGAFVFVGCCGTCICCCRMLLYGHCICLCRIQHQLCYEHQEGGEIDICYGQVVGTLDWSCEGHGFNLWLRWAHLCVKYRLIFALRNVPPVLPPFLDLPVVNYHQSKFMRI